MPHIIKIEGVIGWETDVESVREQLDEANGKDVVAHIASIGGLISEGLKIYNELKNYQGTVDTHLTGQVASMAAYIAMVGKNRTAENNAIFMIHNGEGPAYGDHRIMFKAGTHFQALTNMIAKEYSIKSGTDLAEIRSAMDETTFYYGDEIKDAGFVHEMIGDVEPEDRAEAVAMAELMFTECQAKINTPELIKKDMAALATMLADEPTGQKMADIPAEIEKIMAEYLVVKAKVDKIKNEQQTQEGTVMNLAEIKEKFADAYNEIVALGTAEGLTQGVEQERIRVKMLVEMRGKFPKAHSQKVIDEAIAEGTGLDQLTLNLISADQVAAEVAKAKADKAKPPGNGAGEAPEMVDGVMTHPDHLDTVGAQIASLPGVM